MPVRCLVFKYLVQIIVAKQVAATKKPVGATLLVAETAFRQSHATGMSLPATTTTQTATDETINISLLRHTNAIAAIIA